MDDFFIDIHNEIDRSIDRCKSDIEGFKNHIETHTNNIANSIKQFNEDFGMHVKRIFIDPFQD